LPGLPPEAPETPVLIFYFSAAKLFCIFWFTRILNSLWLRSASFEFNQTSSTPAGILHDLYRLV
jgi:hypothetical protein